MAEWLGKRPGVVGSRARPVPASSLSPPEQFLDRKCAIAGNLMDGFSPGDRLAWADGPILSVPDFLAIWPDQLAGRTRPISSRTLPASASLFAVVSMAPSFSRAARRTRIRMAGARCIESRDGAGYQIRRGVSSQWANVQRRLACVWFGNSPVTRNKMHACTRPQSILCSRR